jgi:hypothetical protein
LKMPNLGRSPALDEVQYHSFSSTELSLRNLEESFQSRDLED